MKEIKKLIVSVAEEGFLTIAEMVKCIHFALHIEYHHNSLLVDHLLPPELLQLAERAHHTVLGQVIFLLLLANLCS